MTMTLQNNHRLVKEYDDAQIRKGEIAEHVTESTLVEKSAIGRENVEELIEPIDAADISMNYNTRSYRTINIDGLDDFESLGDLLMENSPENSILDKKPSMEFEIRPCIIDVSKDAAKEKENFIAYKF